MWCPALASLVGLLLASPTTPANRTIALESRKLENNTLVCRCGMDTSDPKNKDANSKCAKIQYHKDSKGIDDDFSGVHIVNDSACAIDLLKHPKGVCKKDVYVNTERGLGNLYKSITIIWECTIIDEQEDNIPQLCKSHSRRDIYCCNKTSENCDNADWCPRKNDTDRGDFCNDEKMTKLENLFWKDRQYKNAKDALKIIVVTILLTIMVSFCTYRRYPDRARMLAISVFGTCCNIITFQSTNGPYNPVDMFSGEPGDSNDRTDITILHNGSCEEDTSGSGQGAPVCVQRTIAREIKQLEKLAKGRYGTVYKGEYKTQFVAVKKFHTKEEDSWKREVELYNTQSLAHTNILRFIAADNRDNGIATELWLVTDYHEYGSLFDFLTTHTLTEEMCINMAFSIVSGLHHLHQEIDGLVTKKRTIAHRDIKSKNILVTKDFQCCIADLGLACECGSVESELTPSAVAQMSTVGTVRYVAPEFLKLEVQNELFNPFMDLTKADIYSTALVLWELLNRTVGFFGADQDSLPEYQQPYDGMVQSEPTLPDMKVIVVDQRQRPPIPVILSPSSVNRLDVLVGIVTECWTEKPATRLKALRIKKDILPLLTVNDPLQSNR
ncbi:unnamed protein product [Oikopleura dioica]|uniref:receptor protein serine/threonine kinase n=1 Tax=Oikopleura dioica TaxID=34765 RepID=E4XDT3_OIKDI|nr:unnamed protein product [Oikopleura dioica]